MTIAPAPDATGMHDGFARPAFAWVPSIGVSALAANDARWLPLWKDDLLVASLAGESIFRVRRDGAVVQYVERIELGFRMRDMAWMPDGRLALLDESGRAVFLRAERRCDIESRRQRSVYAIGCGPLEAAAAQAAPPPPADVAAEVADRRMTVSWTPVAGAAGYVVAARPTGGIAPFPWREFAAAAAPFVLADMRTHGGARYEVRAAAVDAAGARSAWSPIAATTAPALRPAPRDAITVRTPSPAVGKMVAVHLHNARPFSDRSSWIWFACAPDRSGCKRLPDVRGKSYRYLPGPETLGMRLQVQADYAKDGALWTARADLGVVGPEDPIPAFRPPPLPECAKAESPGGGVLEKGLDVETHLYALESGSAPVPSKAGDGGAIAPLCNDLIVAAPWDAISSVDPSGRTRRHDSAVPMGFEGSEPGPGEHLRVADILLLRRSGERYELFATHHYFAGDCVRFRMSSTTVLREDGAVSVSPSWRTIFDAEPCLPPNGSDWAQAGGRMLADGRGRVLVAVGSHGLAGRVREPGAHIGKLLRVDVETGEAETLAIGLRNPQGLARDEDGRLWWTEHGPQGGDELNLLRPGGDYGWSLATYGVGYGGVTIAPAPDATGMHDGFARPAFAWVPSIGVSALAVNDARWLPLWKDDLLVGSLVGESIFRVRRDGADVQYVERIPLGFRMRDMAWMPDGRLALLDDAGRAVFLRAARRCDVESRRQRSVYAIGCGPLEAAAAGPVTSPSPMRPTPP